MERSRDGRRSGNGVSRRRSRSSGLGESPEEDGGAGLQETVRLRSREAKKDRDRERSGHNRRRRGERMMPESNRDEGDVMSDESVDEEEEGDYEERTSVRMPPSNLSPTSSSMLHNPPHRRSTPTRTAKSPPVWRPADEMISVSIPRKARSAYAKRSHEGEHLHRHSSASTSPSREIKASAPPTSPSSANALIRNKTKPRPTKIAKSPSSIQEIEIEVAEVLFGLTRQIQEPSNKQENSDLNESTAPEILPPQNSTVSSFFAIAPKRKRPRPLKIEEEEQATSSARKNSGEEKTKTENPSPQPGKNSTISPAENGAEVSVNLKIASVQDTNEEPSKIGQTIPSAAETNRTADKAQNLRCEERMEQERETVDAQKQEAPRSASKPEKAIPNPLDGRTTLSNTAQLLSKHCVTHCCIAKNIQYQQQIAQIAPLYGLKPTNPSPAPPGPGPKSSPNEHISLQKKPPSQLPAPAFLFPVSQPHPAVAVKPPNPTLGSSSTASSDLNSPPVTFNYANLANSEGQYFLLQNAGYPFQLPAYRGGPHPQPLPFFNGSVFLHSSQLPPHQSNPNLAGYLTSHVESTQSQRQKSTAEDYPGSSHESSQSAMVAEVNAPTGLAMSVAAAMSRPAGQRHPGFDDKKSMPSGGKASSRPEIDLTIEGSSRTLNLIPCSSTNGPRAPPPNQRQLQFHQQQRHFQLQQQQQQQQQQQLQLHQQLAAQRGKTSTTADVNAGRMPPPPPAGGVAPLQWKTSSSSSPVAIVAGRAPPQLSFGGGRSAAPPAQQSSLVPPILGQRHAGPSLPPQLQKHQALPPGQLFFSNPYYQRPPPDHHVPAAPSTSSGTSGVRGLPPSSLLQAAQFAASSGAHTLMSAAGFPYLHAMPSVPVKPTEHKPTAGK